MTLKWEFSAYKNPIARARGLGAAHHGTHHWISQRLTAVLNVPLTIWAIWSVVGLAQADYATFQDWIATLPNPLLLGLFVMSTFYHAVLGLQVVIEDYVHCELYKLLSLFAVRIGLFGLAMTALFCILKLAL